MKTKKSEPKLKTPILFLVFNRPDTTKRVFEEIKKAKPKQLFIAADGPRTKEEEEKTNSVRKYVISNINWPCKVKKLFRRKNLGCKYAVSGAIDWFFDNVTEGIILEDDCLPDKSFFRFCQELLKRYKNDERIMSISGQNYIGKFNVQESYLFSKYAFIWGWATWKRAWEKMDFELKKYCEIKKEEKLKKNYPNFIERKLRERKIRNVLNKKVDTWDIQWSVSHNINKKLCIIPKINLVENIGFSNNNFTNTKENYWDKKFLHHKANEMKFPLKHPKEFDINRGFFNKYILREILRISLKKFL